MNTEVCEVVITGPSEEWIGDFTSRLVESRLAACGHIIPSIRSIYRWAGSIHDETEARVALHTRRSLVSAIVDRADATHPYDVPCVIVLPIADGSPDYLAWVVAETESEPATT